MKDLIIIKQQLTSLKSAHGAKQIGEEEMGTTNTGNSLFLGENQPGQSLRYSMLSSSQAKFGDTSEDRLNQEKEQAIRNLEELKQESDETIEHLKGEIEKMKNTMRKREEDFSSEVEKIVGAEQRALQDKHE